MIGQLDFLHLFLQTFCMIVRFFKFACLNITGQVNYDGRFFYENFSHHNVTRASIKLSVSLRWFFYGNEIFIGIKIVVENMNKRCRLARTHIVFVPCYLLIDGLI